MVCQTPCSVVYATETGVAYQSPLFTLSVIVCELYLFKFRVRNEYESI